MIERILVAQRALADGRLDQAERLFQQVAEADERNAIAVVGLAEVALARGDAEAARALVGRALAIDPEDAAALRLAARSTAEPVAPPPSPEPVAARPSTLRRILATIRRLFRRGDRPAGTLDP